jgi:hypothetical protein
MTFATVSWVMIAVMHVGITPQLLRIMQNPLASIIRHQVRKLALLEKGTQYDRLRTNAGRIPHQACVMATRSCVLKFNLDLVYPYNELACIF